MEAWKERRKKSERSEREGRGGEGDLRGGRESQVRGARAGDQRWRTSRKRSGTQAVGPSRPCSSCG
eukprot:1822949-Rhodomonas_salina.1